MSLRALDPPCEGHSHCECGCQAGAWMFCHEILCFFDPVTPVRKRLGPLLQAVGTPPGREIFQDAVSHDDLYRGVRLCVSSVDCRLAKWPFRYCRRTAIPP